MKNILVFGTVLFLFGVVPVFSQENPVAQPVTITPPLLLGLKEKIQDNENWKDPQPPRKDADGKGLSTDNDEDHCPTGSVLKDLGDPAVFSEIQKIVQTERSSGRYQWHTTQSWAYCHDREGGRDWIGWPTGDTFHWVLLQNGRFWWHDNYAERWLSFYGGTWWWQGAKGTVQAYLEDGHYHACDANGVLGEDLWTTGVVEELNEPLKKETSPGSKPEGKDHPRHTGLGSDRAGGAMDDFGD